jgi:hypothetical protein
MKRKTESNSPDRQRKKSPVHESLYGLAGDLRDRKNQKALEWHMQECPFEPSTNYTSNSLNKSFDNFMMRNSEFVKSKDSKLQDLQKSVLIDKFDGEELFKPRLVKEVVRERVGKIEDHLNERGKAYKEKRSQAIEDRQAEIVAGTSIIPNEESLQILLKACEDNLAYIFECVNTSGTE